MYTSNSMISICLPIEVDDYLKSFIFKNINYRRKVWNDFVSEAKKFEGDNFYNKFNPTIYKTEYFQFYENNGGIYNEYCVGISEQVAKDMTFALKRIRKNNYQILSNKGYNKLSKIHYKPYDKYYGSFKVHTKPKISNRNKITSRVHIINDRCISFRVRGGAGSHTFFNNTEILLINLKESLYHEKINNKYDYFLRKYKVNSENPVECWFGENDIKEISFIHKLEKFYIQLSINVTYICKYSDIKSRQSKAGIDTGIHNPAVIYNGKEFYSIRMDEKTIRKIHYLERRSKRLQKIMDNKYINNKKLYDKGEIQSIYTKNYEKVRYKYRKVLMKISNIKKDWIYKTCKDIVTNFQIICVDKFKQPNNLLIENKKIRRNINFYNRFHCMFEFNQVLKNMAKKYGCSYIKSPDNTTRTCCCCGHVNEHIPLSQRNLICKKCGTTIDRDINAAQNCYDYI